MGLGRLLVRSQPVVTPVTVTVGGISAGYTIIDGIASDFASPDGYRGGMGIPGAWRAATLTSDLIGKVPWDGYRTIGGEEEMIEPRPPMLEQPCPPDTRITSFSSWTLDLLWHGNAIGIVAARNFAGWPTAFVPVPADLVGVRRVTPYVTSSLPVGAIEYAIGDLRYGSDDILHVKGPCRPGALRGLGVLEVHLSTLTLAREQQQQAAAISRHGVPTGLLKIHDPDVDDNEVAALKAEWLAPQANRTVAAYNDGVEFEPVAWSPEDMQLVDARRMTNNDLENVFGLPVGWLGGMNSARQYSNIEQDAANLLKFGNVGGYFVRFEQALSLKMPRGTVAHANMDAILRPDTMTRFKAHEIAIKNRFETVNEVRALEHLPPLPDKPVTDDAYTSGPPPPDGADMMGGPPQLEAAPQDRRSPR